MGIINKFQKFCKFDDISFCIAIGWSLALIIFTITIFKKPLIAEEALNELMGILHSLLNKDVVLSSLEDEHINFMMKDLNRSLRIFLIKSNREGYIKAIDFDRIYYGVSNHVYAFLRRAYKAGERGSIGKSYNVNENIAKHEDINKRKTIFN